MAGKIEGPREWGLNPAGRAYLIAPRWKPETVKGSFIVTADGKQNGKLETSGGENVLWNKLGETSNWGFFGSFIPSFQC
jgi:hypothetical protein